MSIMKKLPESSYTSCHLMFTKQSKILVSSRIGETLRFKEDVNYVSPAPEK